MENSISIIIPTYNSINYIRHTIYSIQAQTRCNVELIVVDSGSTDGTVEFCQPFADKILYYPPGNMYAAINEGMNVASHEIVTYINSDDCYYQDVLQNYLSYFIENGFDFAYALGDYVDNNGRFRSSIYTPGIEDVKSYMNAGILTFIQPSAIYTKELFNRLGGFNNTKFRYCADYDFFFKVFNSGCKIGYFKERVVTFRITNNQLSNANAVVMKNEENEVLNNYSYYKKPQRLLYKMLFKVKNSVNIIMRATRGYQMSGKLKISRLMTPFTN